jgi:hypothetical protein
MSKDADRLRVKVGLPSNLATMLRLPGANAAVSSAALPAPSATDPSTLPFDVSTKVTVPLGNAANAETLAVKRIGLS